MQFVITTNKEKLDRAVIFKYLSEQSYWAKGRSMERINTSIENSICFGAFLDDEQIGFARVITDFTVFAWLMDVFIIDEFQKQGYGNQLMRFVMNYPDFEYVRRWGLGTLDAHELYKKHGFEMVKNSGNFMEKLSAEHL